MKISKDIFEAVKVLKNGGVIVYPTDTAYGLAADPFNPSAVKKIYQIKGRKFNKPLTLIASDLMQVKKIVHLNALEKQLIQKYWPGPLTILFQVKDKRLLRIGKGGRIGIRIPKNKIARLLSQKCNKPLIATSANLSGQPECYSVNCVLKEFQYQKVKPDLILAAGRLPRTKRSTIILVENKKLKIIRQGSIKIQNYV